MSREGARCRAREHAAFLHEALGAGVEAELIGYRLVVLYCESCAAAPATRRSADNGDVNRAAGFMMLLELPHERQCADPIQVD